MMSLQGTIVHLNGIGVKMIPVWEILDEKRQSYTFVIYSTAIFVIAGLFWWNKLFPPNKNMVISKKAKNLQDSTISELIPYAS